MSNLFSKTGTGRPTSLKQALEIDDGAKDFRLTVASILGSFVPKEILDDVEELALAMDADLLEMGIEDLVNYGKEAIDNANLEAPQAANAFADVANVFVVQLIDRASEYVDDKDDSASLSALDQLAKFMDDVGRVFAQLTPGVKCDPIKYNGKTKKGKLENLYAKYFKSTLTMNSILGSFTGASLENDEKNSAINRGEKLGKIVYLFDIQESKRNSIEQKATRDMMMGMTKDLVTGGGDLSKLLGGLGDNGNLSEEDAAKALSEMLGGSQMPNMPDMSDMNPEEAAGLMKESMSQVG